MEEFEIIQHPKINYIKTFLVDLVNRNPHGHGDIEIGLILEGSCSINISGKKSILQKGDIYLLNQYEIHNLKKNKTSNLILVVQVSTKFCSKYFKLLSNVEFKYSILKNFLKKKELDYIRSLLVKFSYNYYKRSNLYEFKCISILNILLYFFLKKIPYSIISQKEHDTIKHHSQRLNRIVNYIQDNYASKISLTDIAKNEHLSTTYISHFIKNHFGICFQEYINNIRFEYALPLVINTDMTILDICMETGFSNGRYLNKMFIQKYGCSTLLYRQKSTNHKEFISSKASGNIEKQLEDIVSLNILEKINEQTSLTFVQYLEEYFLDIPK